MEEFIFSYPEYPYTAATNHCGIVGAVVAGLALLFCICMCMTDGVCLHMVDTLLVVGRVNLTQCSAQRLKQRKRRMNLGMSPSYLCSSETM